jgi:hypothetical protein
MIKIINETIEVVVRDRRSGERMIKAFSMTCNLVCFTGFIITDQQSYKEGERYDNRGS